MLSITNFLFKGGITVWTNIMAIAVLITAIFSIKSWRDSINKDRENITKNLYKEFVDLKGIEIFNSFSYSLHEKTIILMTFNSLSVEPEKFIRFLVKIGKFLCYKKILLSDIEFYFKDYLFIENEMICLLNNYGELKLTLEKEDFDYLDNLIRKIFPDCKNLVRKNFNVTYRKKIGGKLNFNMHG